MIRGMLALWMVVFASTTATAKQPGWVQQHFGSLDGLPVDSATSAAIDADGFLWLATHDGLARFDGEHFEVYDSMRVPAMSGNRVLQLFKDNSGRVYALTGHGDWIEVRSGRVQRAELGVEGPQDARYVDRRSLCVTTGTALHCPDGNGAFPRLVRFPEKTDPMLALRGIEGTVWMMTRARDVWLYRDHDWRAVWRAGAQQGRSPPMYAAVDANGALWTEIRERALRIDLDGTQAYFTNETDPNAIVGIRLAGDSHIWISASNGVFSVRDQRPAQVLAGDQWYGEGGMFSRVAADGALWVGRGDRLWRLAPSGDGQFATAETVLVLDGEIQDLLFGPEGLVWVMTLRDGVYRLNRPRVDLLGANDGLSGGNVYSVTRGADGDMWLGTLGSGLIVLSPTGERRHFGRSEGLSGPNPWLAKSAPDGSIYVATYAPGLWRLERGSKKFHAVALPPKLQRESIRAVAFDGSGNLWVGSSAGAWRREQGGWQKMWPEKVAERVAVYAMALTENGNWFGTDQGIWFRRGKQSHQVADALLSNTRVRNLRFTHDGALWASTVGRGLVRVAPGDAFGSHALQLGRAQGLPSNSPHTIRQDANGNIWVNSNQGIFRISPSGLNALLRGETRILSPLVLGLSDGLTELEGNGGVQPAAAWDARGRLWFPSQSGVVRFDPLAIDLHDAPPKPVITSVSSEGREVALSTDGALPVGVRNLRIHFGAANLFGSGNSRFRFRLLPQVRKWIATANEHSAVFTALPPGTYRFELLAANSDGVWSEQPTVLEIGVPPYWYERRTVQLVAAALFLLGVLLFTRWRFRRLERKTIELDCQVRQRTIELRTEKEHVEIALSELGQAHEDLEGSNLQLVEQARRLEQLDHFRTRLLADVSHELRTPVMLVSLPLAEITEHAGGLNSRLRESLQLATRQLGRLRHLVEQLVGLVQAESGQMPLRVHRIDLIDYLRSLIRDYRAKAARAGVELTLAAEADSLVLFADLAHLATIFGNLVDNAIKHAPQDSAVTVTVAQKDDWAMVEVRDRGPGFDQELASRLFERFYRGDNPPRHGREGLGIGLSLARELVELHGGRIEARPAREIGASFRVELPLGSEHLALNDLALDEAERSLPAAQKPIELDADGCLLLVEDHPELAAYLADRLGERVPTLRAGSAEEARRKLSEETRIRLVISDVVLPGASGVDLCRELVAATAERYLPVILISAKAADQDRAAGLEAGAVAYIAKPFGLSELLAAVASAWPAVARRFAPLPADPAEVDPLLRIALDQIGNADFSMGEWAALAHLSERQLRRRVKEMTGQSPQAWLREQRLLGVNRLLRGGTCKTLAAAGMRCGLNNPAYLYRSYRARFGDGGAPPPPA